MAAGEGECTSRTTQWRGNWEQLAWLVGKSGGITALMLSQFATVPEGPGPQGGWNAQKQLGMWAEGSACQS